MRLPGHPSLTRHNAPHHATVQKDHQNRPKNWGQTALKIGPQHQKAEVAENEAAGSQMYGTTGAYQPYAKTTHQQGDQRDSDEITNASKHHKPAKH